MGVMGIRLGDTCYDRIAGGHLQVGQVAVNSGPAHTEQLADFGHGFALLQVMRFRRLGFREGIFR
jgi:hypothetical protein